MKMKKRLSRGLLLAVVLLVFLTIEPVFPAKEIPGSFAKTYLKGLELGMEGKFPEARKAFDAAFKLNKYSLSTRQVFFLLDDIEKGLLRKESAADLFKCLRYFVNSRWSMAVGISSRVVEMEPRYYMGYHILGTAYYQLGHNRHAKEAFQKAVECEPSFPFSQNNLGLAYDREGMTAEAVRYYEKAIELAPWYYRAYNNLGMAYRDLRQYRKGVMMFKRALAVYPGYILAYQNLRTGKQGLLKRGKRSVEEHREYLFKLLNDKSPLVRRDAIWALAVKKEKKAVKRLVKMLNDKSWNVRAEAAAALGHLRVNKRSVVKRLIRVMLDDCDSHTREQAARALGKINSPKAARALIEAMDDRFKEVRQAAGQSFYQLKEKMKAGGIIEALKSPVPMAREMALQVMWNSRERKELREKKYSAYVLIAQKRWPELEKLGLPAVKPLIGALSYKDENSRMNAARVLGNFGRSGSGEPSKAHMVLTKKARLAIPALKKKLNDKSADVRQAAAEALEMLSVAKAQRH